MAGPSNSWPTLIPTMPQTVTRVATDGDTAVLTHSVRTTVSTSAGREELRERETIVFHRCAEGRWLAVHEHLPPAP